MFLRFPIKLVDSLFIEDKSLVTAHYGTSIREGRHFADMSAEGVDPLPANVCEKVGVFSQPRESARN